MVRHTRYPGGRDWLPEAFKQEAASSTEYPHRENTLHEQAVMHIRNFLLRRISREAFLDAFYGPNGIGDDMLDYKPKIYLIEALYRAPYYLNEDGTFNDDKLRADLSPHAGRVYT